MSKTSIENAKRVDRGHGLHHTLPSVRNILLGLNKGQPRKLAEWGFKDVIDYNKKSKMRNLK